jgi:hypothetical protein
MGSNPSSATYWLLAFCASPLTYLSLSLLLCKVGLTCTLQSGIKMRSHPYAWHIRIKHLVNVDSFPLVPFYLEEDDHPSLIRATGDRQSFLISTLN